MEEGSGVEREWVRGRGGFLPEGIIFIGLRAALDS